MNLLVVVALGILSILAVGYSTDREAGLKAIRRWRKGDLTQGFNGCFHRKTLKFKWS